VYLFCVCVSGWHCCTGSRLGPSGHQKSQQKRGSVP